ncbi:MAG: alpha/beta hydrolase [Erysipelotrichaceae bacterium]|nr:alpha/beta hydrolase [Erysipelotrichaceae bacterium]
MEKLFLKAAEGYSLSLAVFPVDKAKAVIQIVHGMQEHKERYYPFAEYLNKNGYAVVVSDMRGHGEDAPLLGHIADKKGEKILIDDQNKIYEYIKENFKGLPVYLFGHSMGSIISRVVLQEYSKNYQKVILSGYVAPNPISGVAVFLGNIVKAFGKKKKSKFLASLALGPYSKAVKNRKTDLDWLSTNEDNVAKYIEDPLCGFPFTSGSFSALFHLLNDMGKVKKYENVNKELPILLAGGEDDPCTAGEKGRANSKKVLEKAGFNNIEVATFKGMRHEILNETDKASVYQTMLDFLNK